MCTRVCLYVCARAYVCVRARTKTVFQKMIFKILNHKNFVILIWKCNFHAITDCKGIKVCSFKVYSVFLFFYVPFLFCKQLQNDNFFSCIVRQISDTHKRM